MSQANLNFRQNCLFFGVSIFTRQNSFSVHVIILYKISFIFINKVHWLLNNFRYFLSNINEKSCNKLLLLILLLIILHVKKFYELAEKKFDALNLKFRKKPFITRV